MTIASIARTGILATLVAVIAFSVNPFTQAKAASADWTVCRDAAVRLEQQHNLPAGMVTSIALVESGRRSPDGSVQSWPWTINAEGRSYYFATRNEAVDAVRRMLAEGKRIIDVGCMQINLRFHPRAFTSVEEAFDPMSNVAYAAYFLRDLESRSESWEQAIGRYHSFSPSLNARYSARVKAVWAKEQVAAAALPTPRQEADPAQNAESQTPTAAVETTGLRLSSYADDMSPSPDASYSDAQLTTASISSPPILSVASNIEPR